MNWKTIVKKLIPGIVWQNPYVNILLKFIDPVDYLVRLTRGTTHLPRYSIRVRSNGFTNQFGGKNFRRFGRIIFRHLYENTDLSTESRILEIGCGCGRTAFALAEALGNCDYVGMDIEKVSLESSQRNRYLRAHGMRFDHLDIQNDEYNPKGQFSAHDYHFSYADRSMDVIFLVSVFTHMLTDDVRNYIREISRMLTPGGICMITTFLIDHGRQGANVSFPYKDKEHYFQHTSMPEIAVAYALGFYISEFESHGLTLKRSPIWGSWRGSASVQSNSEFGQDILVFAKPKDAAG